MWENVGQIMFSKICFPSKYCFNGETSFPVKSYFKKSTDSTYQQQGKDHA